MGREKEISSLKKQLTSQNFKVEGVRNGRLKVTSPDGLVCQVSRSPGDGRSYLNVLSRLRKIGFEAKK